MPEVPKLSPLGLSFRKPVRSEGSTETEPSSLGDLGSYHEYWPAFLSPVAVDYSLTTIIENRSKSRKHSQEGERRPGEKSAQTYIQGKDLRILYKKGKISKSRLGTSNRRIRKEERRVEKKGNGILHKGRERKGDSTKKSEKGSKEGTHLDRATTGDRIWKEINMFSRTNRFTPSMTAHQGNNGQSRQRQARMLLPTRPIQGNLTLCAENPSHFRQRGNDDG
ncbi:hypothetical protein L1987_89936 [Smallanthus sonchifolius]|nr:hypothetical protein L1987_89936 [Smallanthus sonchifolius]